MIETAPPPRTSDEPGFWNTAFKFAAAAGLAGMICCVAPMVLFMVGLMGGVYAISFADAFYNPDGSAALGAWLLRGLAVVIGGVGVWLYKRKQDQCSVDPNRKKRNLILLGIVLAVLGTGVYLSFEKLSAWYFDEYIVPAQQREYDEWNRLHPEQAPQAEPAPEGE